MRQQWSPRWVVPLALPLSILTVPAGEGKLPPLKIGCVLAGCN
jgi:hypothetical protein